MEVIFKKYTPLIYKIISEYNIAYEEKEDYLQEGLMQVYKAVNLYDDNKGLFFNFCSKLIKTRFITLRFRKKEIKYEICDISYMSHLEEKSFNQNVYSLPEFQELLYIKQVGIKEYAKINKISTKKVYNDIQKLKKLIKIRINN